MPLRTTTSAASSRGVCSRLTIASRAPARLASSGSVLAGGFEEQHGLRRERATRGGGHRQGLWGEWRGGPPGLPQEIVDYWADVCQQVTSNEDFRSEMNDLGQPPAYRGPAEAKASIDAMQEDMQALVDAYDLAE